MERGHVWIIISALLFVAVPPATADDLGPVPQNDAGSGRDAPDELSDEVTILPDVVYDGMSVGPVLDRVDVYRLVGEAGQTFQGRSGGNFGCFTLFTSAGEELTGSCSLHHVPLYPAPAVAVLPYSGHYYFEIVSIDTGIYKVGYSLTGDAPDVRTIALTSGNDGPSPTVVHEPIPGGCTDHYDFVPGETGPVERFTDDCYHMRTGLNALDTPEIDVLILPPVSSYPERDLRVMRQSVEMWASGIGSLAPQMGLGWLSDGVQFDIFTPGDVAGIDSIWDPEIVVVASNPVGGVGIGIDPYEFIFSEAGPCHTQPNPLAGFDAWMRLDGFDSHHGGASGTFLAECEGGGALCFAVNGAIDPAPGFVDVFGLYDLVAHEVGHCLTIGHVGDAGDHKANAVPYADIMSYTSQSVDKCVSTLDVVSFALSMSRFFLDPAMGANDADSPEGAFHIQHPSAHRYASPTGLAEDCPQPDAGLVPGGSPVDVTIDDDAGSGKDAPSGVSKSITIAPDVVYQGSAIGPLDLLDVYHLTGAAGQTFEGWSEGNLGCYTLLDSRGEALGNECSYEHAPINTGPLVILLPYTGDYYFEIANLAPAVYQLAFSLTGSAPTVALLDQMGGAPEVPADDAGSGADAPGVVNKDVTIEPDVVYEGSALGPVDLEDVYHFVGEAGQTFQGWSEGNLGCYTLLDSTGGRMAKECAYAHAPINTGPLVVTLPYSGDYYLEIVNLAPAFYRFAYSFSGPPPAVGLLDET